MGKKVNPLIVAKEAATLRKLLCDRIGEKGSRAEFGKKLNPERSRSEVHQHEHGIRPIPLEAAKSYAAELGVPLRDLCPRWADQIEVGPISQSQPPLGNSKHRRLVSDVCDIAEKIDDRGLKELIIFAECLAKSHPFKPKAAPTKKAA